MPERRKNSDVSSLERLELSGDILGRIAHDFNNLLTPLLAYPQLIQDALPEESSARELVQVVEQTAQDMLHITRELLMLASDTSGGGGEVLVTPLIEEAMRHVLDVHGADRISHNLELLDDAPHVTGSAEYLLCALTHIVNNAAEAVLEGSRGRGTITVRNVVVEVDSLTGSCGASIGRGRYMRIDVCDDGDGIPGEVEGRVFEPFVTTRKSSERRGAGLGLSNACKIVAGQKGCIVVSSGKGGTVFSIYLPLVLCGVAGDDESSSGEQADAQGAGKPGEESLDPSAILLVDDEATIRKLFKMILGSAFKDMEFDLVENGAEALESFKKRRHGVILMDLHMPVMDGQVAFREIMKTCEERGWAKPAVLFITGYSPSENLRDIVAENPQHCLLSKPVRNQVLISEVSKRLGLGSEAA